MGAESASNSNSERRGGGNTIYETPVVLNVYDLTPANQYTVWFGLGIFHSGIEVHGMEYGFGAHDFPVSGVFEVEPKSCPGFIFRCSIPLGHTSMPPYEFRTFIESVASEYHGNTYHLISKNCNHFTNDIAWRLTSKHIPGQQKVMMQIKISSCCHRLLVAQMLLLLKRGLMVIVSCLLEIDLLALWKTGNSSFTDLYFVMKGSLKTNTGSPFS
ncbi:hypothetical protein ACSBR1_039337 [Camellia fascicularis]